MIYFTIGLSLLWVVMCISLLKRFKKREQEHIEKELRLMDRLHKEQELRDERGRRI